jgi:peptidoglycan hydrolase CwlO-like protein
MYNYTRHQEIARQESERAARANIKLLISLVILLAVLLLSSWLYIARKKLIEDLQATATVLDGIKKENHELKRDVSSNQQQIIENEKRITQLEKKLGRYSKLIYFGIERTEDNLKNSPNYQ